MKIPGFDVFERNSSEEDLKWLLKKPYPKFVEELKEMGRDPKLLAIIEAGQLDGKPDDERILFPSTPSVHLASDLVPTQNEIDVNKSLAFQLSMQPGKESQLVQILSGGPIQIKAPLIILNGEYIIDGHHRWSQIYAMNPEAKVVCYNLVTRDNVDPIDILKAIQLAIMATIQRIEPHFVKGSNLIEIGRKELVDFVVDGKGSKDFDGVQVGSMLAFASKRGLSTKEEIAELIWSNVERMQRQNAPIRNAPNRGVMPQTDDSLDQPDFKKYLNSGAINYKEPVAANERNMIPSFDKFLDISESANDVYIANRLSTGNQVFPAEIHFEPNGITVKIPGLTSNKSQFISFRDLTSVDVVTPLVGWSTIGFWHGAGKMEAHGFTKAEAKEIKERIDMAKKAASR
jgi:hypothetical protein